MVIKNDQVVYDKFLGWVRLVDWLDRTSPITHLAQVRTKLEYSCNDYLMSKTIDHSATRILSSDIKSHHTPLLLGVLLPINSVAYMCARTEIFTLMFV